MSESSEPTANNLVSRRRFLEYSAAASAFTIVPRHVLGGEGHTPPSEKLNIAGIGVGGMGSGNLARCADENIVAICDVDSHILQNSSKKYPKAKTYQDFRRMLDERHDEIDAVVVATPDHTHAVAGMAALTRGKHLYIQKPLAHSIHDVRTLTEAARKQGVKAQLGNQMHSSDELRSVCEWVWADAIGPIQEVHAWSDRPVGGQSYSTFPIMKRPTETPPVPETLDWDLWLGPAPFRPYHPIYAPATWRGWWDFGTGALGDMGCHILDSVFWSLKLGAPTSVQATTTHYEPEVSREAIPRASIVRYEFPAREKLPAVKVNWYDGRLLPPLPEGFEFGPEPPPNGALFIGADGVILHPFGGKPIVYDRAHAKRGDAPPRVLDRVEGGWDAHEKNWIAACKTGASPSCGLDYGGPLTEMVLLGVVAQRLPNRRLDWGSDAMKFTNNEDANKLVNPSSRDGWTF